MSMADIARIKAYLAGLSPVELRAIEAAADALTRHVPIAEECEELKAIGAAAWKEYMKRKYKQYERVIP